MKTKKLKNNNFKIKRGLASDYRRRDGFTLIEIMVATSIFMVVMLIAMGALIITSDAAKKAKALNFTMDNLSFAMESMTRNLRMGTDYYCSEGAINLSGIKGGQNCQNSNGAGKIAFKSSEKFGKEKFIAYDIRQRTSPGVGSTIVRCTQDVTDCVDIISENINIDATKSKFYVKGAENNDGQPNVYIKIKGTITIKNQVLPFTIQTMTSQRTLDLKK